MTEIHDVPGSLTIQTGAAGPAGYISKLGAHRLTGGCQQADTCLTAAVGTTGLMTSPHRVGRPIGRQGLDTAEGVLVALRQCTVDEAFREMIRAAQQHQVPLFTLADALVSAAGAAEVHGLDCADAARRAVLAEWGTLLSAVPRATLE